MGSLLHSGMSLVSACYLPVGPPHRCMRRAICNISCASCGHNAAAGIGRSVSWSRCRSSRACPQPRAPRPTARAPALRASASASAWSSAWCAMLCIALSRLVKRRLVEYLVESRVSGPSPVQTALVQYLAVYCMMLRSRVVSCRLL